MTESWLQAKEIDENFLFYIHPTVHILDRV